MEGRNDLLEFLANSGDGLFAVDADQRIVLWNQGATELLGYSAQETLGRPCYEVFNGRNDDGTPLCIQDCAIIRLARQAQISPGATVSVRTKDGRDRWLSLTHILVPSKNHNLNTMVHVFRDVTEAQEAKLLLRRLVSFFAPSREVRGMTLAETRAWKVDSLTRREQEILRLLAEGVSTRAIAERLNISIATVRNHVQSILSKLNAHTRLEAVAHASRLGLL